MEVLQKPKEGYKFVILRPRHITVEVPVDWCVSTIGEICRTSSGGTPSRSNNKFYNGTTPWIKTGELNDGYLSKTEECISEEALRSSSVKKFPSNTVLFAMYGATIGKTAITTIEATTNQACCAFIPFQKKVIDPYYLQQYLILSRDLIISLGEGAGQPNTSQDFMRTFYVVYPTYQEQLTISLILSRMDELVRKTEQIIEQTQRLKKGLINKLVNRGTRLTKSIKNNTVPEGFELVKLNEIVDINPNYTYQKDEQYLFVEMAAINGNTKAIDYFGKRKLSSGYAMFKNGDTILARITPCIENGKVALIEGIEGIGLGSTELIVLSPKKRLLHEFLYYYCQTDAVKNYAVSQMRGATGRQRVPDKVFTEDLHIVFPVDMELQRQTVDIIRKVEYLIKIRYREKLNFESLKKGLMQKLLTGKIRVKV
ncbi:MAG: restriction endonuclease subunit S [Nitrososphaeraceae archaeon]